MTLQDLLNLDMAGLFVFMDLMQRRNHIIVLIGKHKWMNFSLKELPSMSVFVCYAFDTLYNQRLITLTKERKPCYWY